MGSSLVEFDWSPPLLAGAFNCQSEFTSYSFNARKVWNIKIVSSDGNKIGAVPQIRFFGEGK